MEYRVPTAFWTKPRRTVQLAGSAPSATEGALAPVMCILQSLAIHTMDAVRISLQWPSAVMDPSSLVFSDQKLRDKPSTWLAIKTLWRYVEEEQWDTNLKFLPSSAFANMFQNKSLTCLPLILECRAANGTTSYLIIRKWHESDTTKEG